MLLALMPPLLATPDVKLPRWPKTKSAVVLSRRVVVQHAVIALVRDVQPVRRLDAHAQQRREAVALTPPLFGVRRSYCRLDRTPCLRWCRCDWIVILQHARVLAVGNVEVVVARSTATSSGVQRLLAVVPPLLYVFVVNVPSCPNTRSAVERVSGVSYSSTRWLPLSATYTRPGCRRPRRTGREAVCVEAVVVCHARSRSCWPGRIRVCVRTGQRRVVLQDTMVGGVRDPQLSCEVDGDTIRAQRLPALMALSGGSSDY